MGKRGPKPQPQILQELAGNPSKRPLNPNLLRPSGTPSPHPEMSDVAREVWDRIIVSMPPQLYTSADENILVAYCEAVALHRKAVNAVKSEGEISVSEKTGAVYQNPWIQIMNKQAGLIAQLGGKLGLDPSARNSLVVPSPSTPSSKFEGLVSIAGGRKE